MGSFWPFFFTWFDLSIFWKKLKTSWLAMWCKTYTDFKKSTKNWNLPHKFPWFETNILLSGPIWLFLHHSSKNAIDSKLYKSVLRYLRNLLMVYPHFHSKLCGSSTARANAMKVSMNKWYRVFQANTPITKRHFPASSDDNWIPK